MNNIEQDKAIGKRHHAGLVIAGGLATRLGSMKHQAVLGGKSLLTHVVENLAPQVGSFAVNLPQEQTCDDYLILKEEAVTNDGPLAAVMLGLKWAQRTKAKYLVTMPVDVPFFPSDFVDQLVAGQNDLTTPRFASVGGKGHGLCALWPVEVLAVFEEELGGGVRTVHKMHDMLGSKAVSFCEKNRNQFMNINTADDLLHANEVYQRTVC